MDCLAADAIEARDSGIHGRGVYARGPIAAGDVVTEYTGELIGVEEAVRREMSRQEREARGEEHCDYFYIMSDYLVIDGRDEGNVARLINHSCEPNCRSDVVNDRAWIIAQEAIPVGAELTFDDGYT
ncbi:MAG: SET domain-containing protein-lysine N-methyltransferase [Candidatus Synoicihabitans palmerolidicus]|nr:SET domain-containing protein-lysine N-methyltransferase [Candidatus Synoicihabitans palmerolidicus]